MVFYKYYFPNQSVYDGIDKIVYLCTTSGLEKSLDNGESFTAETQWNTPSSPAISPNSITQTDNGKLYILQDINNIYEKPVGGLWTKVNQLSTLPKDTTTWYLSHKKDMLLAIDFSGQSGIYYSLDAGVNWNKCTGLPGDQKVLFVNEALSVNNSFFGGLDSGGLHRLEGIDFVPSGQGIPWFAKVHFVVGKKVIYRTGIERYYHFCATNVGLFISENDGLDWRLVREGAYSTLF